MKTKNAYRILGFILIVSVLVSMICLPASAEEGYISYIVTTQPDGLSVTSLTYNDGRIDVSAQLSSEKMKAAYNAVTLVALNSDGTPCAIREDEADENGVVEFYFNLDTTQTVSGTYTFRLSSTNTGTLVSNVSVFDELSDVVAGLNKQIAEAKGLISRCEEKGIPTDYELLYLYVAERTAEIMNEDNIYSEYIDYNLPICTELISKAKTNLAGYLDGTLVPFDVPVIKPVSVKVSEKKFVGTVSDGGVEYSSPVFLNGYILGWENKDDSDFLNKLGVNSIPYTLNINRVIGKPNTAYKWEGAKVGTVFTEGDDTLKVVSNGSIIGAMYQMLSLNANEKYTLKFKAKGTTSNKVSIAIGTSGQTDISWTIPTTSSWKEYEYTYTPTSTYKPEFRIHCTGAVSDVYIDDVSFTNAEGRELITNGGFGDWFDSGDGSVDGLFGVNSFAIEEAKATLEDYKQKGYTVVLTGGFSAMPIYVTSMSGVKDSGASYGVYYPYNPTHPMIFGAIKTYLDAVLPEVDKVGNVMCFMIHNEPNFSSYGKTYYADKWQTYLKSKYTNISALNSAYGTSYSAFSAVPMQNPSSLNAVGKLTKQFYDWRVFNDSIITEYHNTVAGYAKDIAPGIPVGTKIMQETSPTATLTQYYGTDYEAFGVNMDVNVNDGWARPDADGQPLQAQMMWYDYQTSINEAPVFNMENHFALDAETLDYTTNFADNVNAMLWQGAIHGMSGSHTWLWGRSDETYPDFINTTVQYRADVMAQVGKTGLDINRLIDEVMVLREKSADAAILFSETSRSYNRQYENALYNSYLGAMYSGVKTDIITESKIANLDNYSMLIIPEATHTTDAVLNEIYSFALKGGKILILADDCLKYNVDGVARTDLTKVNAIKTKATVESGGTRNFTTTGSASVSSIITKVKNFFSSNDAIKVELKDSNNAAVSDVEISVAESKGRTLINLCSYKSSDVTVSVTYNGNTLTGMTDLIDGGSYASNVTLEPHVPVLLEVDGGAESGIGKPIFGKMDFNDGGFSADGVGGTVSESNIKSLSDGNIFAQVDIYNDGSLNNIMLIMALKNEDTLKNISVKEYSLAQGKNTKTIACEVENSASGDYIELYLWKGNRCEPLTGTYKLR